MILIFILLALIILGGYIMNTSYNYEPLGFMMVAIFSIWLLIHTIMWGLTTYDYYMFVVKRNAFEQTLSDSRENGNEYETAAIVKEVAEWNISLATRQYDNKTFYLDQYHDDRIEDLKPIK